MLSKVEYQDIGRLIEQQGRHCVDEIAPIRDIRMPRHQIALTWTTPNSSLQREVPLTARSFQQLCRELRIPFNYLKKVSDETRFHCLNEALEDNEYSADGKTERRLFLRLDGELGDQQVRAVLRGDYTPISNRLIHEVVGEIMNEYGLVMTATNGQETEPTDGTWVVRLADPNAPVDLTWTGYELPPDERDVIFPGLEIVTSEVGDFSELAMGPFTYQLKCTNGLWGIARDDDSGYRRRYAGLNEYNVRNAMLNAARNCVDDASETILGTMKAASELEVGEVIAEDFIRKVLDAAHTFRGIKPREDALQRFRTETRPIKDSAIPSESFYTLHQVASFLTQDAQQLDWNQRRKVERETQRLVSHEIPKIAA